MLGVAESIYDLLAFRCHSLIQQRPMLIYLSLTAYIAVVRCIPTF